MVKEDLKSVIEKATVWSTAESVRYKTPPLEGTKLAMTVGKRLAKKYKANEDVVTLGILLMDIKLGECLKEGKIGEHIQRSADAARVFLQENHVDEKTIQQIVFCVKEHHGTKKYSCKESEIVANADCYKFAHPRGVFVAFDLFMERHHEIDKAITHVEAKLDEKFKILSLPECKKELTPHYNYFKKAIAEIKKEAKN